MRLGDRDHEERAAVRLEFNFPGAHNSSMGAIDPDVLPVEARGPQPPERSPAGRVPGGARGGHGLGALEDHAGSGPCLRQTELGLVHISNAELEHLPAEGPDSGP